MKILIINDSFGKGGKERRITELMKYLDTNSSCEIELVILDDKVEYQEIYQYAKKIHLISGRKIIDLVRQIYQILRICFVFKPDCIHCWGDLSLLICAPVKVLYKTKLINSAIADAPSNEVIECRPYVKKVLNRLKFSYFYSDIITANSNAGLVSYHAPVNKSHCIYNGFNFQRVVHESKIEMRNKLGISINSKVIGMVAAFENRKDYKTAVFAANLILDKKTNCFFIFIGDGELRSEMESLVKDAYKDRVLFTGKIENVENYINIFDIGLLTSNPKAHGEGISNSILEYMAHEKPVIATLGGGTSEIVIDGWNGFLVEPINLEDLSSKILILLNDEDKRLLLGRNALKYVHEKFTIDEMCNKFYSLYEMCAK